MDQHDTNDSAERKRKKEKNPNHQPHSRNLETKYLLVSAVKCVQRDGCVQSCKDQINFLAKALLSDASIPPAAVSC